MMTSINTHQMFNTISHEHLDNLVHWALGEHPDSGLVLVECKDGRWFIEQEYGNDFDPFAIISKPKSIPYKEPNFYSSREEALSKAIELIESVYKDINKEKISEYLKNDNEQLF